MRPPGNNAAVKASLASSSSSRTGLRASVAFPKNEEKNPAGPEVVAEALLLLLLVPELIEGRPDLFMLRSEAGSERKEGSERG